MIRTRLPSRRLLTGPPLSLSQFMSSISPKSSISPRKSNRICIVGSGPSAFYTAKYILANHPTVKIDILEKLPVPFGLVRYGVAPDHQEVKSCTATFSQLMQGEKTKERVKFYGNVNVMTTDDASIDSSIDTFVGNKREKDTLIDISAPTNHIHIDALRSHYRAVILASGASKDRYLDLPKEKECRESGTIWSSRLFVNWYNGHPDYTDSITKLISKRLLSSECRNIAIIGQGNVAIDCARILCKAHTLRGPVPEDGTEPGKDQSLYGSDIVDTPHNILKQCPVSTISIIGRRGPLETSFTIKELRELTRVSTARVEIPEDDWVRAGFVSPITENDNTSTSNGDAEETQKGECLSHFSEVNEILSKNRAKKRIVDLMRTLVVPSSTSSASDGSNSSDSDSSDGKIRVLLRFLCSPQSLTTREEVLPHLPLPHPRIHQGMNPGKNDTKNSTSSTSGRFSDTNIKISPLQSSSCDAAVYSLSQKQYLKKVEFQRNALQYSSDGSCKAIPSESSVESMSVDLMLTSVGYRSVPLAGAPFDYKGYRVPNTKGRVESIDGMDPGDDTSSHGTDPERNLDDMDGGMRVLSRTLNELLDSSDSNVYSQAQMQDDGTSDDSSSEVKGSDLGGVKDDYTDLYVVGWLKRGPSGTIATSVTDSKETAMVVVEDLLAREGAQSGEYDGNGGGEEEVGVLETILRSNSTSGGARTVSWQGWESIDEREVQAGAARSPQKPRVKILSRRAMMDGKSSS